MLSHLPTAPKPTFSLGKLFSKEIAKNLPSACPVILYFIKKLLKEKKTTTGLKNLVICCKKLNFIIGFGDQDIGKKNKMVFENDLNLKATELRLGLPGIDESEEQSMSTTGVRNKKRSLPEKNEECEPKDVETAPPPAK